MPIIYAFYTLNTVTVCMLLIFHLKFSVSTSFLGNLTFTPAVHPPLVKARFQFNS